MHVGIITYQTGHLKTWQIIRRLMAKSYRITLYAFPFRLRPQTLHGFTDRPYQIIEFDVKAFCRSHNIGYQIVNGWDDKYANDLDRSNAHEKPDIYLTCIAKIIPSSFIHGRTILNCHPGLLPHNRGVDAFKWCVVNKWPFGVTLHMINDQIDSGTILHRIRVPVWPNDTLPDVCQRAYDIEGDLLADFGCYLGNRRYSWHVSDEYPLSRKHIPLELDTRIEELFLKNRDEFVRLSTDFTVQAHPADVVQGASHDVFLVRHKYD